MSLLWAVPAVAAAVGAGLVLVLLRSVGAAADDLGTELRALDQLRSAVRGARAEAAAGAEVIRRLRAGHGHR